MTVTTTPGTTTSPFPTGTILGYPRIGPHRELKRAVEAFWAGRTGAEELEAAAADLRRANRSRLVQLGLDPETSAIPSDASYYDHVLDAAVTLGAVPQRFAHLVGEDGRMDLAGYFTLARGEGDAAPLEMTKWFDTNYHYLVPEIGPATTFSFADDRVVRLFAEALADGVLTRPVVVGPVSFLLLSKPTDDASATPLSRLAEVLPAYAQLLGALARAGAAWVQLDEPALVSDQFEESDEVVHEAVRAAYRALATDLSVAAGERPQLLVAAPFGDLGTSLPVLAGTDVEALALDLVRGPVPAHHVPGLETKTVVGGVVDGHAVWRADLEVAMDHLETLAPHVGAVAAGTSTSLLHVPHDVGLERDGTGAPVPGSTVPERVLEWLAFADQKVAEVATLAAALAGGRDAVGDRLRASGEVLRSRATAEGVHVDAVRERLAGLTEADRTRVPYEERRAAQAEVLHLPPLPTTTIGSFPQTTEIRQARARHTRGELGTAEYEQAMREEIARVVALQERIGLDVLVHGEPERNDMVQYFAEHLDGFAVTAHGWVQSYGSRCVRPPVLWGDVSRPAPITVPWTAYARSLTEKPVKGMLTGPVTILAWSFVRNDQPISVTADQVALALREEIADLEAAGTEAIQVDEPALRELLPLRRADQGAYLAWSVGAFRLATSGVAPRTQVHTHLCYSEFGEVIGAIDALEADVTSIEAARSAMEILPELTRSGYSRGIGPGVYDIHSPRVPSTAEVHQLLEGAVRAVDPHLLWVNPDCGLKTRRYEEVTASLENVLAATREVRAALPA